MTGTPSPKLPSPAAIKKAVEVVQAVAPDARVRSVGPEGVVFCYPDEAAPVQSAPEREDDVWAGRGLGE